MALSTAFTCLTKNPTLSLNLSGLIIPANFLFISASYPPKAKVAILIGDKKGVNFLANDCNIVILVIID